MRSCRVSSRPGAAGLVLALALGACSGGRGPAPSELDPLVQERAPRPTLPDRAERSVGRLAALVLANDLGAAEARLESLRHGPHTGLVDNAEDLLNSALGPSTYVERAALMLDRDDLDPALRLRLETHLAEQPLRRADRSLADDRRYKAGAVFNRAVVPLSRLASGATLDPIQTVRSTVASIRVLLSFPVMTPRERKALREWEEFLAQDPDAPEAAEVARRVEEYRTRRTRYWHAKAVEAAERGLAAGSPEAALAHLDRADRLIPESPEALRMRREAISQSQHRDRALRESYGSDRLGAEGLDPAAQREFASLAVALLSEPPARIGARATAWKRERDPGALSDELAFVGSLAARESGDEDGFTRQLAEVASARDSNMARHAGAFLASLDQNPYAFYRSAVRADSRERFNWILFGRRSLPSRRGWRAPFQIVLDLPGRVLSFVTSPLRMLRYPGIRRSFGDGVLLTGERYLARFPDGVHAAEVHARLEPLYAQRSRWIRALEHHEGGELVDPDRVRDYREKTAEYSLLAAQSQPRIDVQVSLLRAVIVDYADTEAAEEAREALREVMTRVSAQRIRISRGFLLEFPELWAPAALGLRPELLDGERANGEIAEDGIVLLGRNYVEISLEDRDPLVRPIPPQRFARFVALLEESSYRELATDAREEPHPDPQRDLFFERARLGLLDTPDLRPSARSQAEFLSTQEKYGGVVARESILPVELVVRGDLDRLGLAAFPRIRLPEPEPDAFLYQ